MMKRITVIVLSSMLAALMVACGGGGSSDPAAAVERYLTAKVGRDATTVQALLCSAMEADLERETRAFETVSNAHIEDMQCAVSDGPADNAAVVSCTGRIIATYGLEDTEFELSSYRVVKEDGEWRWCGEGE